MERKYEWVGETRKGFIAALQAFVLAKTSLHVIALFSNLGGLPCYVSLLLIII
jgi:hypothetical protein